MHNEKAETATIARMYEWMSEWQSPYLSLSLHCVSQNDPILETTVKLLY